MWRYTAETGAGTTPAPVAQQVHVIHADQKCCASASIADGDRHAARRRQPLDIGEALQDHPIRSGAGGFGGITDCSMKPGCFATAALIAVCHSPERGVMPSRTRV